MIGVGFGLGIGAGASNRDCSGICSGARWSLPGARGGGGRVGGGETLTTLTLGQLSAAGVGYVTPPSNQTAMMTAP